MRKNQHILWVILLLGLFACARQAPEVSPTSPPAPAAPSALDGQWSGSGRITSGSTQSGGVSQPITLTFSVSAGRISGLSYAYQGMTVPCTRIDHLGIPSAEQPLITDGNFNTRPGSDLAIQGVFSGTNQASGSLTVLWQGRLPCSASFSADWRAQKVAGPQTAASPAAPVNRPASDLCGVGVDCTQLLWKLLILGLSNGAVLALIATGITLIYATVRILNLAHGDVFALTTALVTTLINRFAIQPAWAPLSLVASLTAVCLAAVGFGALLSLLVEQTAFRPFRSNPAAKTAPLIASLGVSFIFFQAALVWRTFQHSWIPGEHRSVPGLPEVPTDRIPDFLPTGQVFPGLHTNDLFVLLAAAAFAAGVSLFLKYTRAGRSLRAYAQNPQLAEIVGVDSSQTSRLAFALGGGLAGAAAFIFALYYARPFGDAGAQSGLLAFAAALLGGVGSPVGALLAGLVLGVLSTFSDYFLNASWTPVLLLAVLTGLLVLYPGGLGGKAEPEEPVQAEAQPDPKRPNWLARLGLARWLNWKMAALLVLAYPLAAQVFGWGGQMILAGTAIFAILALGASLALNLAGVLDLGAAASFALGGYGAAWLSGITHGHPPDFVLILIFGAGLGGLAGLAKGLLARRLHNNALAAATLALGLLTQKVIVLARPLTGGSGGIGAIPAPRLAGLVLSSAAARVYLVLFGLGMAVFIYQRLARSRPGRAWRAVSADPLAAQASGIHAGAARQSAMLISGILAGAAGALQAVVFGYIDPGAAAFHVSVMALAIVILGGTGSAASVLTGAVLIIGYDKVLIPQAAALLAQFWPKGLNIGAVPDLRGASFFNFGIVLYLTVLLRQGERGTQRQGERSTQRLGERGTQRLRNKSGRPGKQPD